MNDDRIRGILAPAEAPMAPAPEFAASLLGELRDELGHGGRQQPRSDRLHRDRPAKGRRSRPFDLLLVAALIVGGAVGFVVLSGAPRKSEPPATPSGVALIEGANQLRIAIRPDHPQFAVSGQPAVGFDSDVGTALAHGLGLTPSIDIVDVAPMLLGSRATDWDVALPSVPSWTLDQGAFSLSTPYYWWPHRVLVRDDASITTVGGLVDHPVCAVVGDPTVGWLGGSYGGNESTPGPAITTLVVTRSSDADCLAALDAGVVDAVVTAHLSDADIASRAGVRLLAGGPGPEPRVVIVHRSSETSTLDAVDRALAALRADGTLASLSQNRFGGADLTQP
jgi:cystine transport system substrate-binding protein